MALNAQTDTLRTIGNYQLLEQVTASGLGAVYKGRDRATGEVVVAKVMPPFQVGERAFHRFARECRILSALNDPHIVRALDFGLEGDSPYLVMEFVEGESLGQRLARQGRLPEAEAVGLIVQVAEALGRAHGRGLVHRNVKPDNILISADGQAKLTNLGLVKEVGSQPVVTRPGTFVGTPNFMAPEQFRNAGTATALCDVYSLGATLYMAITGELPFGQCKVEEIWARKVRNDLPAPKELVPALSERTDRAIRRAMSPEPGHRPATCGAFVEYLRNGVSSHDGQAVPGAAKRPEGRGFAEPGQAPLHRAADCGQADLGDGAQMRTLPCSQTRVAPIAHVWSSRLSFSQLKLLAILLVEGLLSGLRLLR